ncbi:MAG: hypothetical protein NTX38_18320 [Methylobacter sp.]|nr:hypothetical protein [Methylobacter sp.]
MKITTILSPVLMITGILFTGAVSAYDPGMVEEICKKPQFRDFSLPVYQEPEKTEVAPESTFTFMISAWANPHTIKLTAKGKPLEFTLESNSSFHRVKAKLPADFNGQYVRINTSAIAALGCGDIEGWLIKVANK